MEEGGLLSTQTAVYALRHSAGEMRPISEVPTHLFGPYDRWNHDQVSAPADYANDMGTLIGLTVMAIVGRWTATFFAPGRPDMVEFREGSILFHSGGPEIEDEFARIAAGYALIEGMK